MLVSVNYRTAENKKTKTKNKNKNKNKTKKSEYIVCELSPRIYIYISSCNTSMN